MNNFARPHRPLRIRSLTGVGHGPVFGVQPVQNLIGWFPFARIGIGQSAADNRIQCRELRLAILDQPRVFAEHLAFRAVRLTREI